MPSNKNILLYYYGKDIIECIKNGDRSFKIYVVLNRVVQCSIFSNLFSFQKLVQYIKSFLDEKEYNSFRYEFSLYIIYDMLRCSNKDSKRRIYYLEDILIPIFKILFEMTDNIFDAELYSNIFSFSSTYPVDNPRVYGRGLNEAISYMIENPSFQKQNNFIISDDLQALFIINNEI